MTVAAPTTPITHHARPARLPSPRKVAQAARRQARRLTDEIMAQGAQRTQEANAATALTQATLTDAELTAWRDDLQQRLATILQHPEQHLGFVEEALHRAAQEPLRLLAERAAQLQSQCHPLPMRRLSRRTHPPATPPPYRPVPFRPSTLLASLRLVSGL
jgi:hypothetical protein